MTTTAVILPIDVQATDTLKDLLAMAATTDDLYPFAVWYDESKTVTKVRCNAEKLASYDRTHVAFAFVSFAPRA